MNPINDPSAIDPPAERETGPTFRKELEHLINKHSKENGCNTPDFILAKYLDECLAAFDKAVTRREEWYGRVGDPFVD